MCSIVGNARPAFGADGGTDSGTPPRADGGALDAGSSAGGDAVAHRDGGADAATPLPPPRHVVGKECSKDADCAAGLVCLTESSDALGAGGPAGGLCTVDCLANGQADCDQVDTGSLCAANQSHTIAFCYERCNAGPVSPGEHKCHDRADSACRPSQTDMGYCTPTCRGDFDCPGRVCEQRSGLCAAAAMGTLPFGSSCDPVPSTTDCVGLCSTLGTSMPTKDNSFCTNYCIIGRPGTCGEPLNASGPPNAACLLKFASTETDGDLGECVQLCDCDSNCKNPGFICSPTAVKMDTGRAGACVPKLTFNGVTPGIPCPATHTADAGPAPTPAPDAGAPPNAGTPDGGTIAVSATGGCDCRAGRGRGESPVISAVGALLALAGFRGRRMRRCRPAHS
jgi:hypothetical protein